MYLKDLIAALEQAPQDRVVREGFTGPHSYRGYYERLAFEPTTNVSVRSMLADATHALGTVYEGYKGGDFRMDEWTECYLANYGECGEEIGPTLLRLMLEREAT